MDIIKQEPRDADGGSDLDTKSCNLVTELLLDYEETTGMESEINNYFTLHEVPVEPDNAKNKTRRSSKRKRKISTEFASNDHCSVKIKEELHELNDPLAMSNVPASKRNPKHFRTKESLREEYLRLEKKKIKILEDHIQNKHSYQNDEDYHFLMSLLPQLKRLTPMKKLNVRYKINQILIEEVNGDLT